MTLPFPDVTDVDWAEQPRLLLALDRDHPEYGDATRWRNSFFSLEAAYAETRHLSDGAAMIGRVVRVEPGPEGWAKVVEALVTVTRNRTLFRRGELNRKPCGYLLVDFSDVADPLPLMLGLSDASAVRHHRAMDPDRVAATVDAGLDGAARAAERAPDRPAEPAPVGPPQAPHDRPRAERPAPTPTRMPSLFDRRASYKPFEYPELTGFVDAINQSYWLHSEFSFTSDVQDFHAELGPDERQVITRAMLAISQIEVQVKTFWGDLFHHVPKPEVGEVGATFAESEVRHSRAYSHLLELLGMNEEFERVLEVPCIAGRVEYLRRAMEDARADDPRQYAFSLVLFSLFVENVSLFSQFLVMMSFNKHENVLKDISAVVQATSKEEQLHAQFGIALTTLIQDEHPEWFGPAFYDALRAACEEAWRAEEQIIAWIFESGDLPFLRRRTVEDFTKHRFNESLRALGASPLFEVDPEELAHTRWFEDEVFVTSHTDFFYKRPNTYAKKTKAITADDLF